MNWLVRCLTAVIVLWSTLGTIEAQDYLTAIATALEQSPVYVAPGLDDADRTTTAKLLASLKSSDNIVLIMLPGSAIQELDGDILTIANRLSERLKNQRIIGLAIGKEVVAYAPALPGGVVADLMKRAKSVSNDPTTALITFTQNMHVWQKDHPEAILSPTDKGSGGIWLIVLLFLVSVVMGILLRHWLQLYQQINGKASFKAPNQIKGLLYQIAADRLQINDEELQGAIYQLCLDIEQYFNSSSSNKTKDTAFFQHRLREVADVVKKYIEIQENPRYYYVPQDELLNGKKSVMDFAGYVLDSIRRGNASELMEFKVNTQILQAQRYR